MVELIDPSVFKNLPEVTNTISFNANGPTPDGLYSKIIFGESLKEAQNNFAYINLGTKIMAPQIYMNISKIDTLLRKIIDPGFKQKAILQNGILVENENGKRGIGWLYSIWDQIDFKKYSGTSALVKDNIMDMSKIHKEQVFLDKWLVIPTIYRPYTEDKKRPGMFIEADLTGLYKGILQATGASKGQNSFMDKILDSSSKVDIIQARVNEVYKHVIELIGKTEGLQEQSLVGKRQNNVARLVANAHPTIPLEAVSVPWFVLLGLFDALLIGTIQNSSKKEEILKTLEFSTGTTPEEYGQFFDFIYRNADSFVANAKGKEKKKILIEVLEEMLQNNPEIKVLLKRDPAWTKESFAGLYPLINTTENYVYIVNSMIYSPFAGDSFNTKITGIFLPKKNILQKKIRNIEYSLDLPENSQNKVFMLKSLDYFLQEKL